MIKYIRDPLTSVIRLSYDPFNIRGLKKMQHLISDFIKSELDKKKWFYHGQYAYRYWYSCESQLI